jgi:predicted amidohydrolase
VSLRKIPVAAIQTRAYDRASFEARWPQVLTLVARAGAHGAELVVLPEGSAPAYVLGLEPVPQAQLDFATQTLAALAREHRMTIVYGSAKIVRDRTFNAAICLGPDGTELGYAAKQFLWHFDRRWFAAGTTLEPIETPLGRLGVFVCADGRIPTIAATLVERGASALVMPTAWVTSGRDPATLENIQADLMANVRARENGVPFVVSNKVGIEAESVAYCGKSAIIAADGSFVARGNERDETIVFGEIEIDTAAGRPHYTSAAVPQGSSPAPALAPRARIAFTLARDAAEIARLAEYAALADATLLVAGAPSSNAALPVLAPPADGACGFETTAGVRAAYVDSATVLSPRGLVEPRLADVDLFVWEADGDAAWIVAFARTRAAELRAYVVVFDRARERSFVVDPDGVTLAGTFEGFRMAAFAYDRARAAATTVAPATDVALGLRTAERIRSTGLRLALAD